ncbi:YdeI/OmpD-associated family protein [Christiangramia forsetii]|uniref:YdhG-like domain-containing protein n=2 Tax=Christiangramia forsetii TaxID=411153 RepID=A0LZX3_CHRFK|nr:DUF1801 domain-containing protein [Christiangramia forsetii]GGG45543.1 hypothetical protein GCM10011532_31910 [Christiangramia forsetii]CAL65918.1 conserved hypothetical protein [Christiangramia forsetii KT0803]
MKKSIESFFEESKKWKKEYTFLRMILLKTGLKEEFKWGKPCYTFQGNNIVLIHGFKDYCALLFHKGVLLNDTNNILVQQTKNVQAARQIRFTNIEEIKQIENTLKKYIFEAIEVEKQGLEVKMKKTSEFEIPNEFKIELDKNRDLEKAFKLLTPGRQRGYLLYFSGAKQSSTRSKRIEKYKEKILIGLGLND